MKQNLTEIVFILDASGSMQPLKADTVGGFNAMLEKQKTESGEAYVSTVFFSDCSRVVHDRLSIAEIAPLKSEDYMSMGCTALFDAVGDAIRHIRNIHKYARPEDVPEKTLFVITTDGMENASSRYTGEQIKQMIAQRKEAEGWEFLFLGANIDAAATAESIGIARDRAINWNPSAEGTAMMYRAADTAMSCIRTSPKLDSSWRKELDKAQEKKKK